jgi:hypothetical protein
MPGFPFPGRPGGEHDEPLLDMIIARRALPPDAPPVMHDLARMLAVLDRPAEPGELAGEAAVRAAFSRAASPAGVSSAARRPVRHRRHRRSWRPARSRARLATALVVAAVGLGSVLAAYTDLLPSPVQQLAHVTVAAPAPHRSGASGTLGSGKRVRRTTSTTPHPTPDPAPRRDRSAATSPAADPTRSRPPYHAPGTSRPSVHPGERVCSASPRHSTEPSPESSSTPYSGLPGTWYQEQELCTTIPTGSAGQGNPTPYIP